MKNTVHDIQPGPARDQIAQTHFGPEITFLPKMTLSIWFFGMLSIGECQANIATSYRDDCYDMGATPELYLF